MKISLIGTENDIDQTIAFLLKILLPSGSELSLYKATPNSQSIFFDLELVPMANVRISQYEDISPALENADIVLISAEVRRQAGMTRDDIFHVNAAIMKSFAQSIARTCPTALIALVSNPINSMLAVVSEVLKRAGVYDSKKLFGVAPLSGMNASLFFSQKKGRERINIPVIGGASRKTMLPLFSQVPDLELTQAQLELQIQSIQSNGTIFSVLSQISDLGLTQAQLELLIQSIQSNSDKFMGREGVVLTNSFAVTRFCLLLTRALQGESDIVEYAYVGGDSEYATYFTQPILLCKTGIKEFQDIGKLSDLEKNLLQNLLPELLSDIDKGEKFVRNT